MLLLPIDGVHCCTDTHQPACHAVDAAIRNTDRAVRAIAVGDRRAALTLRRGATYAGLAVCQSAAAARRRRRAAKRRHHYPGHREREAATRHGDRRRQYGAGDSRKYSEEGMKRNKAMLRNSRIGKGSSRRLASPQDGRRRGAMGVPARHHLLSNSRRTADVERLESVIGRFKADPDVANNCEVVFFEIVGDEYLHCNVTHRHATKSVAGWAGPGHVPDGFVHNRRFGHASHNQVVRHIRDMVFAARV